MKCQHQLCKDLRHSKGAYVAVFCKGKLCIGREVKDNTFNIFGGGKDLRKDDGCIISCALRECLEEGKIYLIMRNLLKENGQFKYLSIGTTPIFVARMRKIDLKQIQNEMDEAINDNYLPHLREMDQIKLLDADELKKENASKLLAELIEIEEFIDLF